MRYRSSTCSNKADLHGSSSLSLVFSFGRTLQVTLRWLCLAAAPRTFCNGYTISISGIPCHRVPLRPKDDNGPFCLAVSSAMDLMNAKEFQGGAPLNFLASQVWPSARVAAFALETYYLDLAQSTICEFGCGPGLPSLAAAKWGASKVIATDLDPLALQLVERASKEQHLDHVVTTQRFDLTANLDQEDGDYTKTIPKANLYLFSDVFESSHVAMGAAQVSRIILQSSDTAKIWVFAQSDRAAREDYLKAMKTHLGNDSLKWTPLDQYESEDSCRLTLFDIDETTVKYT